MVVFGQKWLYTGKSCFIRPKVVVFEQSSCNRAKWLCLGKVVVFWEKRLYSGKIGCILAKLLYSGKSGCIRAKWLFSG